MRLSMPAKSPDFITFSEMPLLSSATGHAGANAVVRPNLLVVCTGTSIGDVADELRQLCIQPCLSCRLPGALHLPWPEMAGTLLLHDVAQLTIAQQIALSDWLGQRRGGMQVVSVTQAPLPALVQDGLFLEGLFYRLNTVTVRATKGRGH
jgi:hypothetical protein